MKLLAATSLIFLLFFNWLHADVKEFPSPSGKDSQTPFLFTSGKSLYMTWLEKTANGHALKFAKYDGTNWGPSSVIAADVPFFVNWADFPSLLALDGGMLVAHWLQQSGKGKYAYDVMISVSKDDGKTWSPGVRPHRDRVQGEHGFVSLIPASGGFEAIWLDSRKFDQKTTTHSMTSEMQLMSSAYTNDAFQSENVLDTRVCDCCQTAAAMTDQGPIIVYRDRSAKEVRDISYVRREGNKWTSPKTLHTDQWKIAACPVNGPAVAADGKRVVTAWFTAAGDKPQVYASFSSDSGSTFSKPIGIDSGNPSGRVDVKWIQNGSALVSWLENKGGGGADIVVRKFVGEKPEAPFVVAPSSSARASGFPRLAPWGNGAIIAWTYVGENSSSIKLAFVE
jgi:hypothetical protein